jgi:eukaryotic-like serine/threonine-protein kinase
VSDGELLDGRYRVLRPVGAGGMADVLLARDTELDRPVALKLLDLRLVGDAVAEARIIREARTTRGLEHENVVAVYDVGEVGGRPYIAMEYVAGRTLDEIVAERAPLPPDEVRSYARQALAGLGRAHELGVVHRDVKPSNMIVDPDGRLKLTDFGVARPSGGTASMTDAGTVVGTAAYMSPEQARGAPLGPASDLYSLGVVLFEMLSGRLPFSGAALEIAQRHVLEPAPPLSRFVEGVPAELDRAVARALAKAPEERFASAAEMAAALEA